MISFTVSSINGISRSFGLEDVNAEGKPATYVDALSLDDVKEFLDTEDADSIVAAVTAIDDMDIDPSSRMGSKVLNAAIDDDTVIHVELNGTVEAEDEDDDTAEEDTKEGEAGTVAVYFSIQSCNISIVNGRTTLQEVIYNEACRRTFGQNETQLSNLVVNLNDREINPTQFSNVTVKNGDIIQLFPRTAKTGNC